MTPLDKVSLVCFSALGALCAVLVLAVILAVLMQNASASPFFAARLIVLVVLAVAEMIAQRILQDRKEPN